jgi:ubiquinone/menaquinone biosynthesis C-methylase UbiE
VTPVEKRGGVDRKPPCTVYFYTMNHIDAGRYWNENAPAWTALSRAGADVYRDYLNTPAFFSILPEVAGLNGLDIGCGEGHNTRLLAHRGARMTAIDIADNFIAAAKQMETAQPAGISYQVASAVELPFPENHFDFATGFMSFMEMPETEKVLAEAYRVIKPGGFLQFSISHPCFNNGRRKNIRDTTGKTHTVQVSSYFIRLDGEIDEWIFKSAPEAMRADYPLFKVPLFSRTLSEWINAIVAAGFSIEKMQEPCPDEQQLKDCPALEDNAAAPYFLQIRCRKRG